MKGKRIAVALASALLLASCFACSPEDPHHHVDQDPQDGVCDECGEQMEKEDPTKPVEDEKFDLKDYESLPVVPLSSIRAVQETGSAKFKMKAKWTDSYQISFSNKAVSLVEIFDEAGKLLASGETDFALDLNAEDVVYVRVVPVKQSARVTVTPKANASPLPFDLVNIPDASKFSVESEDASVDPLQPAELNYVKRPDTLYVYSNAPETLVPEVLNKCQTRQDVSNKSVYFTFEHQSRDVGGVFYGYRVTNQGDEDMYVTVKNIGWQLDGAGAYLGELEWTNFYNTQFSLPNLKSLDESQTQNYEAWFKFSGQYVLHDYQPTTYRIPAGQYMYVMGGTTVDAFDGINVDGTANCKSTNAVVENGAVLFDVVGEAEGAFYIYNDVSKVMPGGEGIDTHLGGTIQPAASCGWDVGYVVDNSATWTFNDVTPSRKLPVNYTNYYSDEVGSTRVEGEGGTTGTPNTKIPGTKAHRQENKLEWFTHIDVQQVQLAIGTDVTTFHTVDQNGNEIVYGCNYFDSVGKLPNMGNWMKGFIDVFTFVNQGARERKVRINIIPSGGMPCMLRNMDGTRVMTEGLAPFFMMQHGSSEHGNGFDLACHYEITVPAHTVVQYAVEYNLMANSNGNVRHSVDLI